MYYDCPLGTFGKTSFACTEMCAWQGEAEDAVKKYTYKQLHAEVCKFANVMKSTA